MKMGTMEPQIKSVMEPQRQNRLINLFCDGTVLYLIICL